MMKQLDAVSEDQDLHEKNEPQAQPRDEPPTHPQVLLARDHKCAYRTGKCPMKKATKQNGERHRLCQFHRDKANGNQMRFDLKKKGKRKNRRTCDPEEVIVSCPSRYSDKSIASVPLHMYYPAPPTSIMTKRSTTTTTTTVFREPTRPTSHDDPSHEVYRPVPDLQMLPRDELQILVQLMWSEEDERPAIL